MTNQSILETIKNVKKGSYIRLTKNKDLGNGIRKESDLVMRLGVQYSNMAVNENKETGSLKWGHWVEGLENLVIEHKGNYYLRVTSKTPEHPESGADIIATRYFSQDSEITKEEALSLCDPKNAKPSKPSIVYNIKFENIISLLD